MKRYIFYLRLKETEVHNEAEHVVMLAMTASVIAKSEDTALAVLRKSQHGIDRYDIVDTESKSVNA